MSIPNVIGAFDDLMALAARGREFPADEVDVDPGKDSTRVVGRGIDIERKVVVPKSDDHDKVVVDAALRILNRTDGTEPVLFVRLKLDFKARETPRDKPTSREAFVAYEMSRSAAEYLQTHPEEEPTLEIGDEPTVELSAEQASEERAKLEAALDEMAEEDARYGVFRRDWPPTSDIHFRLLDRLLALEPELMTMLRTKAIDAGVRQRDLPNILAWVSAQPEVA